MVVRLTGHRSTRGRPVVRGLRSTVASLSLLVLGGSTVADAATLPLLDAASVLISEGVRPPALVPTYVPPTLSARGTVVDADWASGRVFMVRIVRPGGGVIAITRCEPIGAAPFGRCSSLAATRREYINNGHSARPMRVRGRPGFLLTRKDSDGPSRSIIWREDGLVHSIGSGTPRRVSLAQLRATAAGLDRLQHRYMGSSSNPDDASQAVLVTGERFVDGRISWQGACAGIGAPPQVGSLELGVLMRQGDRFGVDIGRSASEGAIGWSGNITGVIAEGTVTLTIRATGTFDGVACDTGDLTLTLPVRDRDVLEESPPAG